MRRFLLIFLFLAYTFCRSDTADSLLNRLQSPLADTERVNVLNALCYDYYVNDLNTAIPCGREALARATGIKFKMGMAQAYLKVSYALNTLGHHQAAIMCADSGLVIAEASNLAKPKIKQKQLVEEKQKEILDSIHYAKRIQGSLLTSERYISRVFVRLQGKSDS